MTIDNHFAVEGDTVFQVRTEGRRPLPALWLREKMREADACDPTTGQRLFNPHELPADLAISRADLDHAHLSVTFSDGVSSVYALGDLARAIDGDGALPPIRKWVADEGPGTLFDWPLVETSDEHTLSCLYQFLSRGFVILQNTPTERDSILSIARRFGFVRETNFGSYFEVYSRPVSNDLAYRPVPLAPHTDNPYRDPVPGIQLLHCLANETSGGLSTLVDGLAVCDRLKEEDPEGFRLLTETPVGFRFKDPDTDLRDSHTMIETDHDGTPRGIHYSPRLDETPLLEPETMVAFHNARRQLGRLLADPEFELRFRLEPGQLMMFDNNRVLHGRTSYDPSEGMRHLQGCYIDRDAPESFYRVLSARQDQKSEAA